MDDAARRALRPLSVEKVELRRALLAQMRGDLVHPRLGRLEQGSPAFEREGVGSLKREVGAGQMHPRQRLADLATMANVGSPNPYSVEECDNRRRPPREFAKRRAGAIANRLRTSDAAFRQMFHQTDEERHILCFHPLLVEGGD